MTVHPSPALRAPAPAGYPGAAAVIMRSLVCLYLVVVKSAVATVAGPTTADGIAVVLVSAGLVGALPEAELEAVLAHPANGVSRAMDGPRTGAGGHAQATTVVCERSEPTSRGGSGQPPSLMSSCPRSRASWPGRSAPTRRPKSESNISNR